MLCKKVLLRIIFRTSYKSHLSTIASSYKVSDMPTVFIPHELDTEMDFDTEKIAGIKNYVFKDLRKRYLANII